MPILPFEGKVPDIADTVWVASNATITGQVSIGHHSSIWFQAVIRGDVNKIIIGNHVNIQDGAIIHGSTGKRDTVIGDNVTVGHRAIVHGCEIHDNVMIGMGAIILDNATVQTNVIVGAGSVVTMGTVLESGYLYAGVPAKKIKVLDDGQSEVYIKNTAEGYTHLSQVYKKIEASNV